jgi:hypothetical protein
MLTGATDAVPLASANSIPDLISLYTAGDGELRVIKSSTAIHPIVRSLFVAPVRITRFLGVVVFPVLKKVGGGEGGEGIGRCYTQEGVSHPHLNPHCKRAHTRTHAHTHAHTHTDTQTHTHTHTHTYIHTHTDTHTYTHTYTHFYHAQTSQSYPHTPNPKRINKLFHIHLVELSHSSSYH